MPIQSKDDYLLYLESDLAARKFDKWKKDYKVMQPELYFTRVLRKAEYLKSQRKNGKFGEWRYIRYTRILKKLGTKLGISIYPGSFGPGLRITHVGSVIVNSKVRVGRNCELGGAISIGVHKGGVPKIGNNVYIGPGVVIFGGINIGHNVSIGANAVVNKDIPNNCVVAGVPAKIIATESKSSVRRAYEVAIKRREEIKTKPKKIFSFLSGFLKEKTTETLDK